MCHFAGKNKAIIGDDFNLEHNREIISDAFGEDFAIVSDSSDLIPLER